MYFVGCWDTLRIGDRMNEIFYRASIKNGVSYAEFMRDIKKAQTLCKKDGMPTDEFVKKLTLIALERYLRDSL